MHRKPVQIFVGSGRWDDEAVMGELRTHVREELARPDGVVVIDPSAFPKKGTHSCGVARKWCGRLPNVTATGSRSSSVRARVLRVWVTTRCGAGWVGTTT